MATRYIWIDYQGRLFELEAARRTRIDQDDFLIPLSSLEETARAKAELESRTRNSAEAANIEAELHFKKLTGKAWDDGKRKKGSPPKGRGTTAHEAKVIKNQNTRKVA